jgi:hypothetical protein
MTGVQRKHKTFGEALRALLSEAARVETNDPTTARRLFEIADAFQGYADEMADAAKAVSARLADIGKRLTKGPK